MTSRCWKPSSTAPRKEARPELVQFRFHREGELRHGEIRCRAAARGRQGRRLPRDDAGPHRSIPRGDARPKPSWRSARGCWTPSTRRDRNRPRRPGHALERGRRANVRLELRGGPRAALLSMAAGADGERADESDDTRSSPTASGRASYECPHRDGSRIHAYVRLAQSSTPTAIPPGWSASRSTSASEWRWRTTSAAPATTSQAVTASMAEGLITLDPRAASPT